MPIYRGYEVEKAKANGIFIYMASMFVRSHPKNSPMRGLMH